MNYKEQIEKKAAEYGRMVGDATGDIDLSNATCDAYLAGAETMREIANAWIPVEEEMPEHKKLVLVKGDESGDQIPFLLGWYYGPHWLVIGEEDIIFGEATHWKPITL